ARMLPEWPGEARLRRKSETALYRQNPDPATVIRTFGDTPPETSEGVILLARSHVALGKHEAARAIVSPLWRTEKLDPGREAAIIEEFGAILTTADHRARMERMLYAER